MVASTYVTYTSILGYPRFEIPKKGLYLKHYIDEPNWIYIWVIDEKKIPISYKIVYSRQAHNAMEGVKGKTEEGKFMILSEGMSEKDGMEGGKDSSDSGGGFTIGGDISFYEWDYQSMMPQKDEEQ